MELSVEEEVMGSESEEEEEDDFQQTENVDQAAEGMHNPNWIAFLEGIGKRETYKNRVLHFLAWKKSNNKTDENQAVIDYFECYKPLTQGEPQRPSYAATTLRSWFSILSSFWTYTNRGDLKKDAKLADVRISQWQKHHKKRKAKTFDKHELEQFFRMPNTPDILVIKAYAVVAIAFAARGTEALMLTWDRVVRMTIDSTGKPNYKLYYERLKPADKPDTEAYATVSGDLEVGILEQYSACFTDEMKSQAEGRFLRKLSMTRNHLHATRTKVGKNLAFDFGKKVAELLQLPNPEKYTGHCWRRTSITLMTNSGMSLPQIKAVSGHKSDSVVQGYIDHSKLSRSTAANAVAVVGQKRSIEEVDETFTHGPVSSLSRSTRSTTSTTAILDTNSNRVQPINLNVNLSNVTIQGPLSIQLGDDRTMQGMSSSVEETNNT